MLGIENQKYHSTCFTKATRLSGQIYRMLRAIFVSKILSEIVKIHNNREMKIFNLCCIFLSHGKKLVIFLNIY